MSGRTDMVYVTAGPAELATPEDRDRGLSRACVLGPMATTAVWPLQSVLELGATPGSVTSARSHARFIVSEWGLRELAETVELVVSELVTNSVQASAELARASYGSQWESGTPLVGLWLQSDRRQVLVQVWDASHELPVPQEPDLATEHGRGLLIVEAMSERYGMYLLAGGNGKVVWALCKG